MTINTPAPEKLRVMQLLVGESWGGAERFFIKLTGALHARGLDQCVVIKRDEKRAADLKQLGCPVTELEFAKGPSDLIARARLARLTSSYKPHVVMAWMNRAARRLPRGDFVKVGRLGGYYPLRHYRRCDWLIGNTPDLARYIVAEGWPAERTRMISNFGELQPMPPASRAALDTPEDAFVITAMGRLHPSKGFDTLLDAMVLLDPRVHLWLAGTGELETALKAQTARLDLDRRVRFLGWRDDQAALLGASDLCIIPSRHEPLSNVTLEAWSLGVPVVATASEGPAWLIEHGRTGLLSPIDDAPALAGNIAAMMASDDRRRAIAIAGHQRWREAFSEEVICRSFLDFFVEVTALRRAERQKGS